METGPVVHHASLVGGLCPHFGECGGCASQDRAYADQLAEKEARVRSLLSPFISCKCGPIMPSPDIYFYRNKMEFCFGGLKDEPPLLGLRRRGKFDRVVDLSECRLLSPEAGTLLAAARRWATEEGRPTYHLKSHRGFLRYLVVREGKNTGQRMIVLVTAEGPAPGPGFKAAVEGAGLRVDTAVWAVNAGLSDVAYGEEREVLWGPGFIEENLGGLTFKISPRTFFQTNTRGAEALYGVVRRFLDAEGEEGGGNGRPQEKDKIQTLFDIYCGAGTIGLSLAGGGRRVVGIELNPAAVADARANAAVLGIEAEFHAVDASAFARDGAWAGLWSAAGSAAVLDPPRPGLSEDVRKLLLDRPIERWVYVSCNPEALARDLGVLAPVYEAQEVQPVDMFPHTPHVETVVSLRRRS